MIDWGNEVYKVRGFQVVPDDPNRVFCWGMQALLMLLSLASRLLKAMSGRRLMS